MRLPVSLSQRQLWFLDQLDPGEPTFNMPYAFWLDGPLDSGALQRSLDALAARHSVLRTSLVAFDGVPEQVIAATGTLPIERIDLTVTPDDDETTSQARSIAGDRARQPFDLSAGPAIRVTLIAVGPDRHLLVLVMHHSISDGVSLEILISELSALYRAELTGEPASLPPLWLDYGDYAVWQQDRLSGEELERQLAYWREQLRGAPPFLTLPSDRPRPARLSSRGAAVMVTLDAPTTRRLATVAHETNATMFMVILTGLVAVLSRYARQSDIVVGTASTGRTHAELDQLVGMVTNTILLRLRLADDPTFAALLGRARDTTLDALAHEELHLQKLIQAIVPDHSLAQPPLYQVHCLYGSLTARPPDLPGITASCQVMLTGTAKLDLTLYADTDVDEATTLTLEYSTDLFDRPWADRFLHCLATFLRHAADAPDTPVADLPMLSAADVDEIIVGRNPQPSDHAAGADPRGVEILELLQGSVSLVIDGSKEMSISEVCDRAARLASLLADRGVGPETLVGICVDRGIDILTALLAVWWAGGAYVPLDPGFPQARLAAMSRGAGLEIIISDSANCDLARSLTEDADVLAIDDPAAATARPMAPVPVPPAALAYVIFTSGSTGQPKGVGIEHRELANLIASFRRSLGLGPGDRFVAVTTLSFDIAILELLLPPVCGADLVIASYYEAREHDRLRSLIERTGATAMQAVPQTWRMLDSDGGVPSELRLRLCGGEALSADLADRLIAPGAVLWNVYGPTETTVWSAARIVTSAASAAEIGPPIEYTRIYVLDDRLMPVPVGVVGEVCLAGHGVARGYHDRPRLTARSFRPDPWSDEPGARMYLTGDLGRWREDGGLELFGRNDHQVKVRGFRIECGEIEVVLRAHRDVRQAVVVAAARAGEPELVAYIVPRRGSALAQSDTNLLEELRPHLRSSLPDYMVPSLVVGLPSLPLTPNAKVDRAALPAPQWGPQSSAADRVEPRNPVEGNLARIWGDLLATESPIGVHDNLFTLGAHSLTATKFVVRAADVFGVSLPVHHVFAGPTIAELAEVISADPNFGTQTAAQPHPELDELSDEDLDALLRAALAQRSRRQAIAGGSDT
jgi:amino acid adenylation domain-containing protein